MVRNSEIHDDEVNLVEWVKAVWEGKWKIAIVVIISITATTVYQSTKIDNFIAVTEVKPLSPIEKNKYFPLENNYLPFDNFTFMIKKLDPSTATDSKNDADDDAAQIYKINSSNFLDLYLDVINNKLVFEEAIRKFKLIDSSQYSNDTKYNEAIAKLASSIEILSPINNKKKLGNSLKENYTINFKHTDVEKWKKILKHADIMTNRIVHKILMDEFENFLLILKNDLKYQIEDISIEIENVINDYDRKVSDRISFLMEQSEIARTLGIAKNTIEVQTFGNQNALLSNIQIDSPFYLRGYEAIDKEIELMSLRSNKKAFISGLLNLEIKKKYLEQDKTVERLMLVLQSTPLADKNKFSAASLNTFATKFEYNDKRKMLLKSSVTGLVLGVFYIMIAYAFQPRKVLGKTTK